MPIVIDGTNGITQADQFNSDSTFGFKNRIINGAMVIDQRNAGAVQTFTGSAYSVDRFRFGLNNPSAINSQQVTDAPSGFVNSLKVTCISAVSPTAAQQNQLSQRIEGYNISDLAFGTASAKTVTISFWVKSSLTGTFGGSLSGSNRFYVFSYVINSANTWEQKTVTIPGETSGTWLTNNGVGATIFFDMGSGTDFQTTPNTWQTSGAYAPSGAVQIVNNLNATWFLTGVQLEVGSTATSFDYRPYGTELALCQRYYEVVSVLFRTLSWATIANTAYYKATKRSAATISSLPDGGANGTFVSFGGNSDISMAFQSVANTTDSGGRLLVSAEL